MSDLTDFLLARIAEDTATARAAEYDYAWHREEDFGGFTVLAHDFITSHDPARVLAECEAKRRIVDLYEMTASMVDVSDDSWQTMKVVLRDLALPYADHPDCREEWRP